MLAIDLITECKIWMYVCNDVSKLAVYWYMLLFKRIESTTEIYDVICQQNFPQIRIILLRRHSFVFAAQLPYCDCSTSGCVDNTSTEFEVEMEPAAAAPPPNFGSVARTITKILHLRRSAGGVVNTAPDHSDPISKLKLCRDLCDYSSVPKEEEKNGSFGEKKVFESLLANLFASISAVKAAYAQLQVAQSSYDLDSIQSADAAIVAEITRISELKHSYVNKKFDACPNSVLQPALSAQLQELRNVTKTYRVSMRKLEDELEVKNSEIHALQAELFESERKFQALEAKLHPHRSLVALDALHLSGINPTHFLTALRYTFKAIRSFAQLMEKDLVSAGWDLDTATSSIQPDVPMRGNPRHRSFAFESFVCRRLFSDYHIKGFGLSTLEECSTWDRRQFFDEFTRLKSIAMNQSLGLQPSPVAQFCRAKYLLLVHPKMESSLFGNLDQRAMVSSGRAFPDSEFFAAFAEMARRVWLLHCLFFSFQPDMERSIFQFRRGSRFSEVYMESVLAAEEAVGNGEASAVGFTVVPGFRVGRTLIQSKVYLIPWEPKISGRR